ncbi:MAG TPA: helix-turn-helix domain-containing protein [Chloroflexota bacterium]|nr:helix-turn-helix domain-containing protein [Chloroflexota bacterium]
MSRSPSPSPSPAATSEPAWLSIRQAAARLGVSPATLRLWTAAGKIHAQVTAGGHRRYAAAEIARLQTGARAAEWETAAAALVTALRARYARLGRQEVQRRPWFASFDAAARERAHALGEQLLEQLARLLAAPGARERAPLLRDARRIGAQYGRELARLGLSASDALEAFLLFRSPIVDSVTAVVRTQPGLALPAGQALEAVTHYLDTVLLALTRAYERRRAHLPSAFTEGEAATAPTRQAERPRRRSALPGPSTAAEATER